MNQAIILLLTVISFVSVPPAFARGTHDDAVQQQMDCMDSKIKKGESIDWSNICSTASLIKEEDYNGTYAYSAEGIYVAPESSTLPSRKHTYEIAAQGQAFHYKADDKSHVNYPLSIAPDRVKRAGELYGGYLAKTWTFYAPMYSVKEMWQHYDLPNFVRAEVEGGFGRTSYDSPLTGKISGYDIWQAEGRVLAGYDFAFGSRSLLTPYAGFAYQRQEDETGGFEDFQVGDYTKFKNIRNIFYLPIGVETLTKVNDDWDVSAKVEADPILWGWITYNLNEIPGAPFTNIDVSDGSTIHVTPSPSSSNLKGGIGLRASVKIIRKFQSYDFYVEPFFRFWYLNKTEPMQEHAEGDNGKSYVSVSGAFGAPNHPAYKPLYDENSTTTVFGLRTGVQF